MLTLASRLACNGCLLYRRANRLVRGVRSIYSQGTWPEPITQQTLEQFLDEINYRQEPKNFIDIGLKTPSNKKKMSQAKRDTLKQPLPSVSASQPRLDDILLRLGEESELPPLDLNDALISPQQLSNLAVNHGIYRDLFGISTPKSDYINFTPQQAERLNRLIPFYWITDLPYSRVQRHYTEVEPLHYFEPVLNIVARFVHKREDSSQISHFAHTTYHGNIIPASEALVKPSIMLDGRWLQDDTDSSNLISADKLNNWTPSNISCCNFDNNLRKHYYSVIMLNLDYLHQDTPNLHWFVTNIQIGKETEIKLKYEELCEYLPVHGIRGFGHSRYVFLALRHNSKLDAAALKLDGYSLESRKFNTRVFLEQHKDKEIVPIGLSWFQTVWDESSNDIFHNYLQTKAPVYDLVQPQYVPSASGRKAYPGRVPFNLFLDHCRKKKDINEQVLLERLKQTDPYDYRDQYLPPKVPPTVFDDEPAPSWMKNVLMKKKLKIGYWRGLRPASVMLPLNNNADLDHPIRPYVSSKKAPPGYPNLYQGKPVKKMIKDLPYSKPTNEHQSVYVLEGGENFVKEIRELVEKFDQKDQSETETK